jgi:hypothetical protein
MLFNNVWFSDEVHFPLDGVVNKQIVWFGDIRESMGDSWEGATCTKNYNVGRHLKSWTARANFLSRDSEQWALLKLFAQCFCASPSCYRFADTNSVVNVGWSQAAYSKYFGFSACHFWLACHLKLFCDLFTCEQDWLLSSPDVNPCDYFLWGFLEEKIFPKKLQTIMELRALIIQACNKVTKDMCSRVINITVCTINTVGYWIRQHGETTM